MIDGDSFIDFIENKLGCKLDPWQKKLCKELADSPQDFKLVTNREGMINFTKIPSKEYMPESPRACFGHYYNENGDVCKNGASGLCNYCVECQRDCKYY